MNSKMAYLFSSSLDGLIAKIVQVEINIKRGIPRFSVVGLAAASIKEATDRVRIAIENSGFEFPLQNILVNLSPAGAKKDGSWFDLPIALGILKSSGQIESNFPYNEFLILGELGLDGSVRPLKGITNILLSLKHTQFTSVIVPEENKLEASLINFLNVYTISHLSEINEILSYEKIKEPHQKRKTHTMFPKGNIHVYNDQILALRAIEISLAGHHHLLMIGSPGSGKSMLAKLAKLISPPLSDSEFLDVLRIKSSNEHIINENFLNIRRPFRSPHHTASDISIVGGGRDLKMGEVTLAHRGILFLDELGEFKPHVIQSLREPMEEGKITISRVNGHLTYPSSFIFVGATNPCPCGYYLSNQTECICSKQKIRNYFSKFSGPFLDRIDLEIELYLTSDRRTTNIDLEEISTRIQKVRKIQEIRFAKSHTEFNGRVKSEEIDRLFNFDEKSKKLINSINQNPSRSLRKLSALKKTARTIADILNSEKVQEEHLYEAMVYQSFAKYFSYLNEKIA
ncbi:MAG: YifB family Mg chelatase-like AAA ATPase [Leptospiraceae bacterium]|nr:YifB family Mg chelatase-like AAA ATPase [Leptospiraceae bacterium]MCK6379831.1 YifB family Mg chelatase-like AAA ATPase [Leptospiraceae bacterium]NUM40977.1 YifB family Mg chelatase-like AAA ATPase [Leptospiraceae bacterium]